MDDAWFRARRLFDAALDRAPEERRAFVMQEAGADHALRDDVLSLLDAGDGAGAFLAGTRVGPAARVDVVDLAPGLPSHIGPWRVLRELGRGGMGTVYLGTREAGDLTLQAALKVVAGADRDDILRRFRTERRILASLDHPGIARLLDGGTTADGLPYFALEYVEGVPLTEFARTRALDLGDRLALFSRVCEAVEFAHRRLVVHRDLKPANILVGADGAPKLLDFGIARLLATTDSDAAPATVTSQGWMTPAYASPEQLRGEPTSTATDVYALGLILYELLTDGPAFPAGLDPMALAKAKLEGTLTRPSAALERGEGPASAARARRAKALRGDLDTIVLTAVATDAARRYASVAELAAEIERYRSGRPVLARPDALAYLATKFVRRHRWAVGFAAVAVVALVTGLVLALLGQARARRAEGEARTSAVTAERVSEFMVGLFSVSDPSESRGNAVTARELLDRGADRVSDLKATPDVQSRLRTVMARAYGELGLYERQAELLTTELADVTARAGAGSADALTTSARLAQALMRRGEYVRARDMAEAAVAGFDARQAAPNPGLVLALSQAGVGHWRTGDLVTARARLERALAVHDAQADPDPRDLIGILNNVAILRLQVDDLAGGRPLYQRALDLSVTVYGARSPSVANTLNNLAVLETSAGNLDLAAEHHRRALDVRREVLAADHPDIAESLHNLGEVERRRGQLAEARAFTLEAWERRRRKFGDDHATPANSETNLGLILLALGELAEARPRLVHALAVFERALGPTHLRVSYVVAGLGNLELAAGRPAAAEPLLRRAVAIIEARLGPGHREARSAQSDLEKVLRALGRPVPATAAPAAGR